MQAKRNCKTIVWALLCLSLSFLESPHPSSGFFLIVLWLTLSNANDQFRNLIDLKTYSLHRSSPISSIYFSLSFSFSINFNWMRCELHVGRQAEARIFFKTGWTSFWNQENNLKQQQLPGSIFYQFLCKASQRCGESNIQKNKKTSKKPTEK